MDKRKIITELINGRFNRYEESLDNTNEETSKETNDKVLSLTARVLELIQENITRNRNFKYSSDLDDNNPKNRKPIDSYNSDKDDNEHKIKKVYAQQVLGKVRESNIAVKTADKKF
jgi:hypothetical protein